MANLRDTEIYYWAHMLDEAFCKETDWSSVSKDYFGRRDKQDEWYTSPENALKIVEPFKKDLHGKKVYCNCDDPEWSGVYKLLYSKFHEWGLAKLVCTGYGAKYKAVVTPDNYDKLDEILQENPGNGDMNSKDSLDEARAADIIVSNPPFSRPDKADDNLFRNWVKIAFECNCGLIGIGMTRAVKEKFIARKVVNSELFVYYCPRYKFGRSGQNLENMKGKVKNEVQVSIYSTFDEDLDYGPDLKFDASSHLQSLPTTVWEGQQIPATVKVHSVATSKKNSAEDKDGEFSRSIIPPPTQQNLGQLVAVPFNVIDLNWKDYFILKGVIDRPTAFLPDGEKKNISSAIVLQYNKATAPDQEDISAVKDLTDANFDTQLRAAKLEIDKLFADGNVEQLRTLRKKYYANTLYTQKNASSKLKHEFYSQIYDYAANTVKMLTGELSTEDECIQYINRIYNTSKLQLKSKVKYISRVLRKLSIKHFYATHPDKYQEQRTVMTSDQISSVQIFAHLISQCLQFNQKYAKFSNLVKKNKRDGSSSTKVRDAAKALQKSYEEDIKPRLSSKYASENLKNELQYKLQRISDLAGNIEANVPFATVNEYARDFSKIVGSSPSEFAQKQLSDMQNQLSSLSTDKLESIYNSLHKLRPKVGMYIIYLERNIAKTKVDADPDVYDKIMQKTLEVKAAIANASKACKSLLKKRRAQVSL